NGRTSEFSGPGVPIVASVPRPSPGALQFSQMVYTVGERDESITIAVNRTGGSAGFVLAELVSIDGTAVAGSDYVARSTPLTFGAGETSQSVTFSILDDNVPERDETVTILLRNIRFSDNMTDELSASLVIADDDSPAAAPADSRGPTVVELRRFGF